MYYLFQLGHQPQISAAELAAVFSKPLKTMANSNYAILETENEIDAQKLVNKLGGTIKIARAIPPLIKGGSGGEVVVFSPLSKGGVGGDIGNQLTNYLITVFPSGKIEFSLNDPKLALETKKELKSLGRSVRYIELKNTATILYNKLVEKKTDLTIFDNKIFVTVAIQPFEEFSERDYGRPGSDNKSGMLPPKLARIMINLAVSGGVETQNFASLPNNNITILDPFCGSGTILTEALTMGYTNLIGSDISTKAISDTKKNLDWIIANYHLSPITYRLHTADATKLSSHLKPNSIDAIITEPYLGQPLHGNETDDYLKKQIAELKNLYLNSFKEFYKILKPNGVVVFIIPSFVIPSRAEGSLKQRLSINIQNEIKKIGFENLPFTVETQNFASLQYHRPNQHLAREIWRFKKN